jgi:hypothetical protein
MPDVFLQQVRVKEMSDLMNDRSSVLRWAEAYMKSRSPDFVIGDNQLQRWHVVPRNDTANVYLHRFLKSDEDRALHDHPFDNTSWILSGSYLEHFVDGAVWRSEGNTIDRVAEIAHRVELTDGPVVTLFTTGPRRREWGFYCPQGWRHWREFVSDENRGGIGRGCE